MKPEKARTPRRSLRVGKITECNSGKKNMEEILEKENKELENNCKNSRKREKILEESPIPTKRANIKSNKKYLSSDESDLDDEELDEIFLKLSKSGIKTVKTPYSSNKKSPKSNKENNEITPAKQKTEEKVKPSPSTNEKKSKKRLIDEFDTLACSPKDKKFSPKDRKKVCEKVVPQLEKLPEDLILNFKRTPVKSLKVRESEETPKKENSVTPLRRSTRRSSSVIREDVIYEEEKTPTRKSLKTPIKRSSTKKKEVTTPRTPLNKIEEKKPSTPLEKARLSLHVSTVPDCLPCRENEYQNVLNFLENKLWDGVGGCMYISGVPGTGKTATVTQVIKYLQNLSQKGKVPEFKYIEMNGMRLTDPRQAYVQLWQKLFEKKEKITPDRAQKLLDDWFSKSDRKNTKLTTVLLVDELDLICTKKQDVVYNLLDWPTRTHSRLVVLTIANTMDMPERLFKGRVTSRMGLTRLTFMPYTHKQLEEIVLARLNGLNAFVTDAVRLVTRKVAAVSGDARRALDICRRATELPPPDETVKISHIEQAIKEMTNSNIVKVIRGCGEIEKLFLRSLSDVSFQSNMEEVDLREVIDQLQAICVLEGIPRPSISSILSISNKLKCSRLIFTNQPNAGILQRLTLNVTHDDIHYALKT